MLGAILNVAKNVLKGFISGAVASVIGYAKKEQVPNWDIKKMLQEMFLGAFTSAMIYGSGMPISNFSVLLTEWLDISAVTPEIMEFAILTGMVILVDHIVKVIVRRTEVMTLWNRLKEFLAKYA